jgi:hypothetical protein
MAEQRNEKAGKKCHVDCGGSGCSLTVGGWVEHGLTLIDHGN